MTTKLRFKCSIGPQGCYQGGNLAGFLVHVAEQHPGVMEDRHPARHDEDSPSPCECYLDGYLQGREEQGQEPQKPPF